MFQHNRVDVVLRRADRDGRKMSHLTITCRDCRKELCDVLSPLRGAEEDAANFHALMNMYSTQYGCPGDRFARGVMRVAGWFGMREEIVRRLREDGKIQ